MTCRGCATRKYLYLTPVPRYYSIFNYTVPQSRCMSRRNLEYSSPTSPDFALSHYFSPLHRSLFFSPLSKLNSIATRQNIPAPPYPREESFPDKMSLTFWGKRKPTETEVAVVATSHFLVEKASSGIPMKVTPASDGSVTISRTKQCYICDTDVALQGRYYRE